MKIKNMPTDSVIPYDHNPRQVDAEAINAVANSIKRFGFEQPLVVDAHNVLIVGHTRLLASKRLKLKTVPVVVADNLTPEQVKAYRLADNKTGELSEWDFTALDQELDNIAGIDMSQFGFENIVDDDDEPAELEQEDKPEQSFECPHCHALMTKSELIKVE